MSNNKQPNVPVYYFMGLLESGKTSVIIDFLSNNQFAKAECNLIILGEEGEEELDEELLAESHAKVITVEEHNIIGGLGETVCSCLSEKCPTPVKRIGINDEFGHSGPAKELLKQFGLSAENIVKVTKEFLA